MSEKEQTVELCFGKANPKGTYMSLAAQRVRAPFVRESGVTSGRQVWARNRDYMYGKHDVNGTFCARTVEHKEGTILLLQSSWKRNGAPIRDGAIFIRLRSDGPEYAIRAKVPLCEENCIGDSVLAFCGRGDIMNVDDFALYGLEVPRSYREKFIAEEEVDECFDITNTMPGAPKPNLLVVRQGNETKLVAVAVAPRRRLRLGK